MIIKTGGNALVDAGWVLEKAQVGQNMKIADLANQLMNAAKLLIV